MRLLALGLAAFLLPAPASSESFVPDFSGGPVVFDFEDGLQGWTLQGGAERVESDALGGSWAIRGDGLDLEGLDIVEGLFVGGFPSISLRIALDHPALLTLDLFRPSEAEIEGDVVATLRGLPPTEAFFVGAFDLLERPDGQANPGRRSMTLYPGTETILIAWASEASCQGSGTIAGSCGAEHFFGPPDALMAFIDHITLSSLPEPPTLLLSAAGIGALRRSQRSRSPR